MTVISQRLDRRQAEHGEAATERVDPVADHPPPKDKTLESIRGLAATFVVIHHVPDWNSAIYDIQIIRNGGLLVDLFFVLSGFVIYSAYAAKIGSWRDLLRFQFLRLGRLYPVHLLFLAVFVVFEISKYFAQSRYGMAMPNTAPFRENNGVALIEQLFLVQAIGPTGNALTFNTAAWSISVEFYTYLIFGLTVLFAPKAKNWIFGALAAIAIVLLFGKTTFGASALVRCIGGFSSGCLAATAAARLKIRFHRVLPLSAIILLIVFLQLETNSHFDAVTYFLSVFLILSLVRSDQGWVHWFLSLRFMTWLGTISYSIYMSHGTVIWVLNQVFRVVLKTPAAFRGSRVTPQLPLLETLACYVIVLVCVLLVSEITYKLVEAPLRRKSREIALRRASRVPAGVAKAPQG